MNNKRFATIDIETESNVGVIDLRNIKDIEQDKISAFLMENVEHRLVEALEGHFCCPVRVRVPANIKTFNPITIEYIVVVSSEDKDYQETVTLNETWVY
jgi:hypothetical protein